MHRVFVSITLFCATFVLAPLATAAITIDTVPVGNAGNTTDTTVMDDGTTGYGSVAYDYRIGTYEVTNSQYVAFLNAKAASDPLYLYNTGMGIDAHGGISRSGVSGSFSYAAKANMGNKPVNYVSWYDSIRFANWLNNGQGNGSTETGAYTLGALGAGGIPTGGLSITRNVGATWFLTSENEWYKAAYHQPTAQGGDADNYWLYPTASNITPRIASANSVGDIAFASNPVANVANFNRGADWNSQDGNVTTVGSAGPLSQSFYGTSDQGGNIFEWNEALIGGLYRGVRGGSWAGDSGSLQSSSREASLPLYEEDGSFGFRVASIPEGANWINPAGGQFDIGANWLFGTTPTPVQTAVFDLSATYTVTFAGSQTNDRLRVREGSVTLDLGGSTYSLTSNSADSVAIGDQAGNVASLTLTNGTLSAIGNMQVGGGTGLLTVNAGGVVNVGGTLTATSGGAVTLSGGSVNAMTFMIPGGTLTGFGTLNGIVTGSGTVTASGGTLTLGDPASAAAVSLTGTLNVGTNAHAVLVNFDSTNLGATTTLADGAELTAAKGLVLGPGKTLTATGSATVHGVFTNSGLINGPAAAGTALTFAGDVDGTGSSITGNIQFAGKFTPGVGPATVSIAGNVTFAPTATLRIEIGGTTAGLLDQVVVGGQAALGGTLDVDLINGFHPGLGDSFTVMTFVSRSGDFATYADASLGGHLALKPQLMPNSLVLKALPAVAGDINLDGTVNIFDINSVSSNWNTAGPQGDANGDGTVNIFDINLISANWTPTGASVVPEPTTLVLAVMAGLCGLVLGRRDRP